jgi:hypothetical protein
MRLLKQAVQPTLTRQGLRKNTSYADYTASAMMRSTWFHALSQCANSDQAGCKIALQTVMNPSRKS